MIEFFRHCPGCGRRFHIKLVDKSMVGDETTKSAGTTGVIGGAKGAAYLVGVISEARGDAYVREGPPLIFDIKEFRYVYKCKHCGHEWSETRLQDELASDV